MTSYRQRFAIQDVDGSQAATIRPHVDPGAPEDVPFASTGCAREVVNAITQAYLEPGDSARLGLGACRPANLPGAAPAEACAKATFSASLEADDHSPSLRTLSNVWEDLSCGRLRPLRETTTRDRVSLVFQVITRPSSLSPEDASLVANVLCGEARKALASELEIAVSTASGRLLRALAKLELADRNVALPLVLAAQSWAGVARIASARAALFDDEGCPCLTVSVPRPATTRLTALTRGEQRVAQWLIEGLTRHEIADRRQTSVYTVSRQFHSIFAGLRVTGRYALIRRAVELGCFHELWAADASDEPGGSHG